MDDINARFIQAIKELGLTQAEAAQKLGLTKQAITLIKKGVNKPSGGTLSNFCKTFNVNYPWLVNGEGEMFAHYEDRVLEHLQEQYDMSDSERIVIQTFLQSDDETRKAITRFLKNLAKNVEKARD